MEYIELQNAVAELNGGYWTELDRIKCNGVYCQKNRVHVFKKDEPTEVAKIIENTEGVYFADEGLPEKLVRLIETYANTPVDSRGVDDTAEFNLRQ